VRQERSGNGKSKKACDAQHRERAMERRPLLVPGCLHEATYAGLHERRRVVEVRRKGRTLEHVMPRDLLSFPAIRDEGDQAVVETVQRDGLPPDLA
jgi:hypothetical protein